MAERLLQFFKLYPLDLISHLSSVFPIVAGLFRVGELRINLIYVWLLFIFCFLKDTYSLVRMFVSPNNLFIRNIEPIFETVLVGLVFLYSFEKPVYKRIIVLATFIGVIVTLRFYNSQQVSAISLSAFRVFAIALALSYFNKILVDMRVKSIVKHGLFWFTSGLLIYCTGTFFIVLFSEYWYQDINKVPRDVFDRYWNVSQVLFVFFALMAALGLWTGKYDRENLI